MQEFKKAFKEILYCAIHIYINYFIAYIPCWIIRKFLYKLLGLKIGKGSRINQRVYIFSPWRISIGDNTMINSFAILDGRDMLTIGSNSSISMRSAIYTASHKSWSDTFEGYTKPTTIGNGVWIGLNAVVLAGACLEDNVIVGANSLIKGKTEAGGVYIGVPAEMVKKRDINADISMKICAFFL